jgi:rhamnose transport system substrate-binding protein
MLLHNRFTLGSRKSRVLAITAVGVAAALALAGCSSSGSTASGGSTKKANLAITFLPKSLGNAYFNTSDNAGKAAIQSFGGTYAEVAPANGTANAQVPFINTLTQKGVGAIILSSDDPKANCSALAKAQAAGIKVVTFDSDTNPSCRDLFINQATAQGIAEAQVAITIKEIGTSGEVAYLSANPTDTNQNQWIKLMNAEFASKYPNIKVDTIAYGGDSDQTSFTKAAGLLQTYPNLKAIISPTTVGITAAARYLSTSSYKGKVALTGLGTPNQMKPYVKDGTVKAFALWNPGDLGTLAAYAAKALITGQITGKQGDTFTAGKLGKFTVGADHTVLLGKPYTFDSSNIDKFNF